MELSAGAALFRGFLRTDQLHVRQALAGQEAGQLRRNVLPHLVRRGAGLRLESDPQCRWAGLDQLAAVDPGASSTGR